MSYFSDILTATKTRYASLRANDDADGDTEDDSHITRALRNYYLETPSRTYPAWLPPPLHRTNSPAASGPPPGASLRNTYGRKPMAPHHGSSTSLSDIWDTPTIAPQDRVGFGRNASSASPHSVPSRDDAATAPPAMAGGMTAQERIKARLWGGRGAASPPPPQQQYAPPQKQGYAPYAPPSAQRPERVDLPVAPAAPRGGAQPYTGASAPWDDGYGGGYQQPEMNSGGGSNMRRGAASGGRAAEGRAPYR